MCDRNADSWADLGIQQEAGRCGVLKGIAVGKNGPQGAREVLAWATRWRVGNGEDIIIRGDRWVPKPKIFKVVSTSNLIPSNAKVSCLINHTTWQWNMQLIDKVFWEEEVEAIKKIPLVQAENGIMYGGRSCKKRGVKVDNSCPICKSEREDLRHALFRCPNGLRVWEAEGLKGVVKEHRKIRVVDWIYSLLKGLDNDIGFPKGKMGGEVEKMKSKNRVTWEPPQPGFFKINFDGAVFKEDKAVGVGVVIRDCDGRLGEGVLQKFKNYQSPKIAEMLAARESVRLAENLNLRYVIFEEDTAVVVRLLFSEEEDESNNGTVVEEVKQMMLRSGRKEGVGVGREGNKAAHQLVRHAKVLDDAMTRQGKAPSLVEDVLKSDKLAWIALTNTLFTCEFCWYPENTSFVVFDSDLAYHVCGHETKTNICYWKKKKQKQKD
ncbi:hypothetical protein ACH5RR_039611 [Cinchona calisaya]|uniref:RNase H type-1 domain-containing protein n=1 Tax=Cinchona calisaya TaxID=153742 RepID=A0ABD2XZ75_9GENT